MVAHKYPYGEMEKAFVEGTMSVRQLCKDFDIKTWSTVSEYAKRHDWLAKRDHFMSQLAVAETAVVVGKRATELAKALDDAVMVSGQAIYAFLDSLKDRWVEDEESGKRILIPAQLVTPSDFSKIVNGLQMLSGRPTVREAHLSVGITGDITDTPDGTELLLDVIRIAREAGAGTRETGSSPLPRSATAKSVH